MINYQYYLQISIFKCSFINSPHKLL